MAFIKFEVVQSARPEVTIKGDTIYLTPDGVSAAGLQGQGTVALYFDVEQHRIGIEPAGPDDRSSFKARHGTRGASIRATAFMQRFNLTGVTVAGGLHEAEGITAFNVNLPSLIAVRNGEKPYTGKRRGRKPKVSAELE